MNVVLLLIRRDQWTAQEIPFLTYHICDLGVVTRGWRGYSSLCAKNPNNVTSTFFNTVHWVQKAIRFEHGGAKLDSCPGRHQASLRPCVLWILQQIISRSYTVTSHWWISILDRICYMKTWNSALKSFTQLKLIKSPVNYFLLLWNNVYAFFGTNYCIPKWWPMGPLRLSSAPLAQTSSFDTAPHICVVNLMFRKLYILNGNVEHK